MLKKEVRFSRKAQFSMEYLLMMGFAILLLIPIILLFITESNNMKTDIALSQLNNIALKISEKSEEVYYQGAPSRTTITANFPYGIQNITISGKDITFIYLGYEKSNLTILEICQVNVTGNISTKPGIHKILIKSEGDYVSISED